MSAMIDVYRNSVQKWECDQMGHMNVQFYVDKAASGLSVLAHHLGLDQAGDSGEAAQLQAREYHIRFQREQRAGMPLSLQAGILEVDDRQLRVYLELTNPMTGEIAATFIVRAERVGMESGQQLAMTDAIQTAARRLSIELPPHGAPRGIELYPPRTAPDLKEAQGLGMPQTYLGPVLPAMCGVDGILMDRHYMAVISDAVPHLLTHTRRGVAHQANIGGAALEYRLVIHRRPRAGDILSLHSGIKAIGEKPYTLGHWLFDYRTGEAVVTAEAVAVMFDLQARKAIAIPEQARAALEQLIIPGFSA